ncbi:MAG: hypothetical protein PHI61_05495, partial [Eubacteriales bacterium]|nr:hypothetical protein [Eubacteriales bacterium]
LIHSFESPPRSQYLHYKYITMFFICQGRGNHSFLKCNDASKEGLEQRWKIKEKENPVILTITGLSWSY